MILIFGGAYQGKKEFARNRFRGAEVSGFANEESEDAAGSKTTAADGAGPASEGNERNFEYAFSGEIVCGLENFVWECCAEDPAQRIEAADWMREHRELWQDKVLIITDVSQGIVPMDARTRAFREMNGRLMLALAKEADEVWRVFCGIGKQVK